MTVINADNATTWQAIANDLAKDRPSVGKVVTVLRGKRKGLTGTVRKHILDRYSQAYRWGGPASHHMRDMCGRHGWAVLVDTGAATFWTKADNVTVAGGRADPEADDMRRCREGAERQRAEIAAIAEKRYGPKPG